MSQEYLVKSESLTAIADAIRAKISSYDALCIDDMADEISFIQSIIEKDSLMKKTIRKYKNNKVNIIGAYTFAYCISLTTVNFPKVISISSSAFYWCSGLTSVSFPVATTIGVGAFGFCSELVSVSFPAATTISGNAFKFCDSLTTVDFPVATTIGSNAFIGCDSLKTVNFPTATSIGSYAFRACTSLTTASFPAATTIGNNAFERCYYLSSLYLTGSTVCTLGNIHAFLSTPIAGYYGRSGSIYVPASLLASYQTATNWSYFSSRFVGI